MNQINYLAQYAGGHIGFEAWLIVADREVSRKAGVGLLDLPDVALRDWYDDGITPREAAELALENDDCFPTWT